METGKIKIKVEDWLAAECDYLGCVHNSGDGICNSDNDSDTVDIAIESIRKAFKDGLSLSDIEEIECHDAEFYLGCCEVCGEEKKEIKEYPTGERQFLPVAYEVCSNRECKECEI